MKKINSITELVRLSDNDTLECFISLAGGLARSSKSIFYDSETKLFNILHEIDGTCEDITEVELLKDSNIGKALEVGALYTY
jgi:hypothetical protein